MAILNNISKHITLDDEETRLFLSAIDAINVPKKTLILKEGQACQYLYFIQSGTMRAYYLSQEGKESTIMLAVADWWITDMHCFLNALPAMLFIEALEDCVLYRIQKKQLDELYIQVPKFERFFRILMQNAYTREQVRVMQNLSLSAEERYHRFIEKYPQLLQQVTQKQIASYLGITPEFLSAIRSNKRKH